MNPEHEPDLTDKSDIDPSIKATNLVVQEGENMGAVNAFETEQGAALTDGGENKLPNEYSDEPYTVEGLPVIGADAEQASRHSTSMSQEELNRWDKIKVSNPGADHKENTDQYHDESGTEAMAAEVKRRAMAKVPEGASDELREEYGELAATKFRDELKAKQAERKTAEEAANAERQAVIDVANSKTQEMIDKLKNIGTPLSEAIEIPEVPVEDPGYIDTSVPEAPAPGHN